MRFLTVEQCRSMTQGQWQALPAEAKSEYDRWLFSRWEAADESYLDADYDFTPIRDRDFMDCWQDFSNKAKSD